MAAPLVWKVPNSTHRLCPGSWNSNPGVNNIKSTTDTKTGPQSNIFNQIKWMMLIYVVIVCWFVVVNDWLIYIYIYIYIYRERERERERELWKWVGRGIDFGEKQSKSSKAWEGTYWTKSLHIHCHKLSSQSHVIRSSFDFIYSKFITNCFFLILWWWSLHSKPPSHLMSILSFHFFCTCT